MKRQEAYENMLIKFYMHLSSVPGRGLVQPIRQRIKLMKSKLRYTRTSGPRNIHLIELIMSDTSTARTYEENHHSFA